MVKMQTVVVGLVLIGICGIGIMIGAGDTASAPPLAEATSTATPIYTLTPFPLTGTAATACPAATPAPFTETVKAQPAQHVLAKSVALDMTAILSAKVAEAADGYIVFVDRAAPLNPNAAPWPREKVHNLARFYDRAAREFYAGRKGFANLDAWAEAFGLSKESPLILLYDPDHPTDPQPSMRWHGPVPIITYGKTLRVIVVSSAMQLAVHEMAHVWDRAHEWTLSAGMAEIVQNPGNYPTAKARNEGAHEDFAESVTAYLWPTYAINLRWSDDDPRFSQRYDERVDTVWQMDRYDYIARLFAGTDLETLKDEAAHFPKVIEYSDVDVAVPPNR